MPTDDKCWWVVVRDRLARTSSIFKQCSSLEEQRVVVWQGDRQKAVRKDLNGTVLVFAPDWTGPNGPCRTLMLPAVELRLQGATQSTPVENSRRVAHSFSREFFEITRQFSMTLDHTRSRIDHSCASHCPNVAAVCAQEVYSRHPGVPGDDGSGDARKADGEGRGGGTGEEEGG
jgi:hypothetical protein